LVNTGLTGTGKRVPLPQTRAMIDAIMDGSILKAPTATVPHFNLKVPTELPGVDVSLLDPRNCYADVAEWDAKAKKLTQAFQKNFAKFMDNAACAELAKSGPQEE
jgi:phosphoenolpyruvate carboxykinase (ATP)